MVTYYSHNAIIAIIDPQTIFKYWISEWNCRNLLSGIFIYKVNRKFKWFSNVYIIKKNFLKIHFFFLQKVIKKEKKILFLKVIIGKTIKKWSNFYEQRYETYILSTLYFFFSMSFSSFDYKWKKIWHIVCWKMRKIYIMYKYHENIILNIYKKKMKKIWKNTSITDII